MPTIDDSSRSLIKGAFKKKSGKIWSAAVAKVYRCDAHGRGPRNWTPATKAGALLFLRDAEQDENMFLRLVDIDNAGRNGAGLIVLWEHEMWIGFEWARSDQPYFYTFESDDCVYGVMFSDVHEASDFAKNVSKRIKKIGRGTALTDSDSASIRSGRSNASSNNAASGGRSFFKSIFNPNSRNEEPEEQQQQQKPAQRSNLRPGKSPLMSGQISESDIGDPVGFKHMGHIGFNPDTGTFDMKNIPPQWQKFLDASGVTKADLQNKETATFIAGFLDKAVKGQAGGNGGNGGTRKAPPPPPPKGHKAAPPPPPTRTPQRAPQPRYEEPVRQPVAASRPAPASTSSGSNGAARVARNIPAAPPFEDYLAFIDETKQAAAARQEEQVSAPKPTAPRPAGPDLNSQLMAGIKGAGVGSLKRVERPDPASLPPISPSMDAPGDAMAGLLAKALQSRQRAMAHSESEEDDNDEWS